MYSVEDITLMRELFSSERDVDKRISELTHAIERGWVKIDKTEAVCDRIKSLQDTKTLILKSISIVKQGLLPN